MDRIIRHANSAGCYLARGCECPGLRHHAPTPDALTPAQVVTSPGKPRAFSPVVDGDGLRECAAAERRALPPISRWTAMQRCVCASDHIEQGVLLRWTAVLGRARSRSHRMSDCGVCASMDEPRASIQAISRRMTVLEGGQYRRRTHSILRGSALPHIASEHGNVILNCIAWLCYLLGHANLDHRSIERLDGRGSLRFRWGGTRCAGPRCREARAIPSFDGGRLEIYPCAMWCSLRHSPAER